MFERPESAGETAIIVQVDQSTLNQLSRLTEFEGLVRASGAKIVDTILSLRRTFDPKTFIGSGKTQEIEQLVQVHCADVVIFNHDLSPAQERNLERIFKTRVISRTGLILDIFAQRARTHEGKLQVELAQLTHMSTRLVRGWTHLERQKGGIGLRGPGETQLETDRRLLRKRIDTIERRLAKVEKHRALSRRSRQKQAILTVSLVGYTNAGKSTLFNSLTESDTLVADQLFATLDPSMRVLSLASLGKVVLVDTVGFIQDLPHQLVDAFRSTLEETVLSDLLLHVVDASDDEHLTHMEAVTAVLTEIDAQYLPQLQVYNKCDDLIGKSPKVEYDEFGKPTRIWLSALDPSHFESLRDVISQALSKDMVHGRVELQFEDAKLRATLYNEKAIVNEELMSGGGWQVTVQLPLKTWNQLCQDYPALQQLQ